MAFPALIQKIYDLRRSMLENQQVCAAMAKQVAILADRITKAELEVAAGTEGCAYIIVKAFPPEGVDLDGGSTLTGLTLVDTGSVAPANSALKGYVSEYPES